VVPLLGNVGYKSRSLSAQATEAEILSASDAGHLALYLHSVLDKLGHPQKHATIIFEDNCAAVLISQASHPTRQTTRHINIREFALLLDWNDRGLIILEFLDTSKNASDMLTKQQCPKVL
jgi:hypothetical protein